MSVGRVLRMQPRQAWQPCSDTPGQPLHGACPAHALPPCAGTRRVAPDTGDPVGLRQHTEAAPAWSGASVR